MNYITQLNRFYDCLQTNSLSAAAICLYVVLLHINNKCAWIVEFTVANLTLQGMCNLSRVQIDRARNELVQKGYIKYKKGIGNKAGKYLIVCFDTQCDTQSYTQSDTQCDTQTDTQMIHNASTLNKLNSKLNETKLAVVVDNAREVFLCYENLWGTINPTTAESLGWFVDNGLEPALICAVLDKTQADGKRWTYAEAVLHKADWDYQSRQPVSLAQN